VLSRAFAPREALLDRRLHGAGQLRGSVAQRVIVTVWK
jgi:hypothetical protein